MGKLIMGLKLSQRQETARALQEILTRYGCVINTRLGFHDAGPDSCSEQGYILLEFVNDSDEEVDKMKAEIQALGSITLKTMEL